MGIIQKQAVSGTFYIYIGAVVGFITSGLLFPRILEPEQIGLLNLLISYSLIFSQFGSLGFNSATTRLFTYFRDNSQKHNGFLFIAIAVTLLGFLIAVIGIWVFSIVFLEAKINTSPLFVEYYWYLIPLVFCTMFFLILDSYSKVLFNAVRGIIIKEFLVRVVVLCFIVIYFYSIISFHQFVLLYISAFCIPLLIIFFQLYKDGEISFSPKLSFINKELKTNLISVSLYGILISATGIITFNIDKVMLESMLGENGLAAVGIYSTAFFFGTIIILPSRALLKISSAVIADAWKENRIETIKTIYQKSAITQLIIGSILFIGIWVNIDNIFIIISDKFVEGKYVIFYIGLAFLSDMATGVSLTILGNSKYYKTQGIFMLIMAIIIVLTNYIFIPIYGIVGAAFASFLSKLVVNILRFLYLKKKFGLQPYNIKFIYVLLFGIIAYLVGVYMPTTSNLILNIALKSIPTAIVFSMLVIFGRCSEDINNVIFSYLNKVGLKINW